MKERHTLWQLIDEHRVRRASMLSCFIALWTACLSVPLTLLVLSIRLVGLSTSGAPVGLRELVPTQTEFEVAFVMALLLGVLLGLAYTLLALERDEGGYLGRLGAIPLPSGMYPVTRSALEDVIAASGLSRAPRLFLIPDYVAVNAVVLGRTPDTAAVAVTQALATRTDPRLQRAVFASLVSRFRDGGVSWTSLLFMLMRPVCSVADGLRAAVRGIDPGDSEWRLLLGIPVLAPLSIEPLPEGLPDYQPVRHDPVAEKRRERLSKAHADWQRQRELDEEREHARGGVRRR